MTSQGALEYPCVNKRQEASATAGVGDYTAPWLVHPPD